MSIEEIRGRLEAATPGPWEQGHGVSPHVAKRDWVEVTNQATICPTDAEFIAHAPEDMRRLLNAVEAVLDLADDFDTTPGHRGAATSIRRTITSALEAS